MPFSSWREIARSTAAVASVVFPAGRQHLPEYVVEPRFQREEVGRLGERNGLPREPLRLAELTAARQHESQRGSPARLRVEIVDGSDQPALLREPRRVVEASETELDVGEQRVDGRADSHIAHLDEQLVAPP